eukprot:6142149-Alexandrium_andersonii.AAC.1
MDKSALTERFGAPLHGTPSCCVNRPAPNVYRQAYTKRCKPLAAVCSGLQRLVYVCRYTFGAGRSWR